MYFYREQLKLLIESYREAEIARVEVEKENMRRARENEAIFSKQQHHLEGLLDQQKSRMVEARTTLADFQRDVGLEKQKQRSNVEKELGNLMRLKHEHRACYDWSEHAVRKKKFKLKVKIEEYWKRMDLYETLLLELEIEKSMAKQDVDEKLSERIKLYEQQQENELNELREQIAATEHDLETYQLQFDSELSRLNEHRDKLHHVAADYDRRIGEAERFCGDVKTQEETMLAACSADMEAVQQEIRSVEEKLHSYTIYKMHECCEGEEDTCSNNTNTQEEDSIDCRLVEETQRAEMERLCQQKNELELLYDKKVEKYSAMYASAQDALVDLRQDRANHIEQMETELEEKISSVRFIEERIKSETDNASCLRSELKAHERPRSFIGACPPEESEEDVAANQQQIEQLLQSREKVRAVLETTLRAEFDELKTGSINSSSDVKKGEKEECGSVSSDGGSDTKEHSTAVDKALDLVLHAGGHSQAYMDSLITKNNQYQQRRRVLINIRKELQDLMRYQMTLHREVAENFLTQKSLFEEVRSQERRDIHETIQTLILEGEATGSNGGGEDEMLCHIVKESERIIEHQLRLDELENQ